MFHRKVMAAPIAMFLVLLGLASCQQGERPAGLLAEEDREFKNNDPIQRACKLGDEILVRLWRGHDDVHSEDIITVPQEPNYSGSFNVTSHSGPWDYVQTIPLVLYGPSHIKASGQLDQVASITDVFPTIGALGRVDLPQRDGEVLEEAIDQDEIPKLIVVVVWDGVGRNVLEFHPKSWPTLKRMEEEGTSYLGATVGSSPSITPATHSSLGTGTFPRSHGVTAIEYREDSGKVRGAFAGKDPSDLRLTTFADELDLALDNGSKVGMLAWKSWHLGMLGHGSQTPGGDADELALINGQGDITSNPDLYSKPGYLQRLKPQLAKFESKLDRQDGKADGKSLGHDVVEMHDNPAWVWYEQALMLKMLEKGGYGEDFVPDIFLTNYKISDIVAHQYSMDSKEEEVVLEAQDGALNDLLDWLNVNVRDYVVIVTADHGNTPAPERSGAWPIQQGQLKEDVDAHFNVPKDETLFEKTSASGPFLDYKIMNKLDVTFEDVARFLNDYTIAGNWAEKELPKGYEDRGEENVFSAAFPSDSIDEVMKCAFGERTPPADFKA